MSPSRRRAIASLLAIAVLAVVSAGASGAGSAPPSGAALVLLSQPPTYSSLASQRIYFVMPDRYANGDPSNDRGGLTGSSQQTGYSPADPAFWHGGDLKGLTGNCTDTKTGLARIKSLGFTAIWVTPVVKNQVFAGGSAGYHGYWGLDFTQVDPHLGTNADFAAFVGCAHSLGMKVYLDIVVNHTGDVIQLGGTGFVSPAAKPYRDCRGKPYKPALYVTRTFPCTSAKYTPLSTYVLPPLRHVKKPEWLNDVTNYHDRGNIDFSSCSETCYEQGDFYGLDDLFTEKPVVMKGLAAVYSDWIRKYKVDGFRVDTARHVNAAFFKLWTPRILAAARSVGIKDFPIFGEVASNDDAYVSEFVRDRGLPFTLDFPFQDAAAGYVAGTTNARALHDRLDDDDYWRTPSGVAPTPPTFLGNHDMGRAAFEIEQQGAPASELLPRVLLGYDLMYMTRGAPTVYYGDEVGMIGRGGDQQARQDMFPTQVQEWQTQDRVGSPPIGTGSSFDVTANPIELELKKLGALRDANPALSTGPTIVRYASGRVLAFSRVDTAARREYVAAFNAGTSAASVVLPTSSGATTWTTVFGSAAPGSASAGRLALTLPPLSAVLLRADSQLPVSAAQPPARKLSGDDLSNMWRLTATVKGAAPVSVAFGVKRAKGNWQRLDVDDTPPYRGFLDPAKFKRNEKVQLVAVERALDGSTAVSPVVDFTVRGR
jgi:alpha-amylase